jgi:hypothetical protein
MEKIVKIWLVMFCLGLPFVGFAQQDEDSDKEQMLQPGDSLPLSPLDSLRFYERRLTGLAESIITARSQAERVTSTYFFARTLISALKQPNSFDYPFDSAGKYISILMPPDKSFRIFTWSLKWGDDSLVTADSFEFYGAIQVNNKEKLELYGLYDSSAVLGKPEYEELNNRYWYGALYYQIIETKYKKQKYYTLLGWDGYSRASNRKIADVLTFDENGKPKFGAPIFDMADETPAKYRVIFEFRDDATMTLRYIGKKDLIAFENLIPPDEKSIGMYQSYLPDGSYDYFVYKKGKWKKREMLFENVKNIPMEEFAPNYQQQQR